MRGEDGTRPKKLKIQHAREQPSNRNTPALEPTRVRDRPTRVLACAGSGADDIADAAAATKTNISNTEEKEETKTEMSRPTR